MRGIATISTTDTSTNGTSHHVGFKNSNVNAATVAISVTNVDESRSWPIAVPDNPISTMTANTTARLVVDNATPPISAAFQLHPARNRQASSAPVNGAANDANPIETLGTSVRRIAAVSISAPAWKVSTIEPSAARKASHCGRARSNELPATTPRTISTTATDNASSTDAMLATNTMAATTAAVPRSMTDPPR